MRYAVAGMAVLVAAYLLLWEAGQPVIAAQFMLVLGKFDPRVCAIMSPLAFGAALTGVGVVLGIVSLRSGRPMATWAWFIVADGVAPIIALVGHGIAIGLLGARPG
jgi:hypothetical protein